MLSDIRSFIEAETPWSVINQMTSPIQGEKGNTEFLLHLSWTC